MKDPKMMMLATAVTLEAVKKLATVKNRPTEESSSMGTEILSLKKVREHSQGQNIFVKNPFVKIQTLSRITLCPKSFAQKP